MSCCARQKGLVEVTENSLLTLIKPYKTILTDVDLNSASISVKIFLVDLNYAQVLA